ncbi:hypothetical protein [Pseudocnuella soli]|uniref:hypothetical protein n=1 Tax=Pseudocnuella soli TaxID=2502779 RepID=UPI00105330E6|nr:hypothetical protein [Pseudocnuella soli]
MRNTLFILLLTGIFSCSGKSSEEHFSFSKRFYYVNGVYDITTDKIDKTKPGFTIFDSSGRRIESADLSETGVHDIAMGWHSSGDTLIMNLGKMGVYAYRVGSRGTHKIQIDSAIKKDVERLK